ncbi:MAG: hypothetical protein RJA22_3167 [Verrucomicrobiota bacterium]|jgi:5-formyltetrahydrofolate cyclo-ligase
MAEDPAAQKAALRRQLLAAARALSPTEAAAAAADLRERLLAQPAWRQARAILLYAPAPEEPDVWPLLDCALREGRTVALPRHDPGSDTYHAAVIRDPAADLVPGRFGLREPGPDCPEIPLNRLDLALVPGVGFALNGARLGRGKGYFDRLLPGLTGLKCGVAFDCQLVPALPVEAHDAGVDVVLTPTRWHRTGDGGSS